jgi:cell division inhibitor SepF
MPQHGGEVCGPGGGSPGLTPRQSGDDCSPQMLVFKADRFEDAEAVMAAVRGGRTVVLNVPGLPEAAAQRLVDFVCGGITAMDGQVRRLGEEAFLLAPALASVITSVQSSARSFRPPLMKKSSRS